MKHVIIGVDPHKLSATIEVVDDREQLLGSGRFSTDQTGYTAMRRYAKAWPDRFWAIRRAPTDVLGAGRGSRPPALGLGHAASSTAVGPAARRR